MNILNEKKKKRIIVKDIILNWNSLSSIKDLNLLKAVKYLGDY